ncbi:Phosphate-binding protein PstS [Tetrabaena socialis]|uniref:Phosphate-binding protein PstS n=1 Tax=Tetrabaena socialis TaxID=47790 RepID=A0A2J8A838_9CHLO|nr:Phosphate-binding protein PstS [Tetrabaena socialis]|eukprot:PNH08699.1 Phosphate-binding protein PstS [Tetrabaena socialis]
MLRDGRCWGLITTVVPRTASIHGALFPGLSTPTAAQQGDTGVLTINAEGPAETQLPMLRIFKLFETRLAIPARIAYRITNSNAAAASIVADQSSSAASTVQFVVSERALSTAERTSFTSSAAGDSVHYPMYLSQYGFYYNVPGNRNSPLNLTACLAARILKGDITDWTHPDLLDKNPSFVKAVADSYRINVFVEDATSGATLAVFNWLAKACPSVPLSYGTMRTDLVMAGLTVTTRLQSTAFALGYTQAFAGRTASIAEFALETATAGVYVQTGAQNVTNLRTILATSLPTTLTGDYGSVSTISLAASRVAPIVTVAYLITKTDWSQSTAAEGQRGEAVKSLCAFIHSSSIAGTSSANGLIADYGLISIGNTMMTAAKTAISTAFVGRTSAVPYTTTEGSDLNVLSSTRTAFDVAAYADIMSQITAIKKTVDVGAARVLRGAGSSAVTLFMWRCFSEMRARSTSPVHLVYRATGSGGGQTEIVAKANGYTALLDFGASDTPLSDALYTDLTANAKIPIVHIPIMLLPMSFFVNIPESALPTRQLRASPCTLAKIMQGDITSWAHPDIAADNSAALPDQPIVAFYRQLSSGTTATITEYLTRACPSWRLGSGGLLTTWPSTFKPTANSINMSSSVATTPWSIGYMDAANGLDLNLLEIAVKNRDGNFVTSQTGDVPSAALALFKSDAWPKSPTQSFTSVSVLNQPGNNTFPIVAMPFMFVRTDLTSRGDAGPLLQAFLQFMLSNTAQNTFLTVLGFAPLPAEVRQYATDRALPLLQVDTRAKAWTFEIDKTLANGAGSTDYVISSFAGGYENANSQAFADFYKVYNLAQNKKSAASVNTTNTTTLSITGLADVPANLRDKLDRMDKQIAILQAIAITGIVFGIVGLSLAAFAICRAFVHAAVLGNQAGGLNSIVHANSMTAGSSVRRKMSVGQLSEGSFH